MTERDGRYLMLIFALVVFALVMLALGVSHAEAAPRTPGAATVTINTQPSCALGYCAASAWVSYQGRSFMLLIYGRNLYIGKTVRVHFNVPSGGWARAWVVNR